MNLQHFNALPHEAALAELIRCCGSTRWAAQVIAARPFASAEALETVCEEAWAMMREADWLEAFRHHPKIGDIDSLRAKFASTAAWAAQEQAGSQGATEETLQALKRGNEAYERKFGYIFIICATGKSAPEMLAALERRLANEPAAELPLAAEEQKKITRLRLEKAT